MPKSNFQSINYNSLNIYESIKKDDFRKILSSNKIILNEDLSNFKFSENIIKFYQNYLFLQNFSAEEIFEEIFYELNFRMTQSFFKLKMKVFLKNNFFSNNYYIIITGIFNEKTNKIY